MPMWCSVVQCVGSHRAVSAVSESAASVGPRGWKWQRPAAAAAGTPPGPRWLWAVGARGPRRAAEGACGSLGAVTGAAAARAPAVGLLPSRHRLVFYRAAAWPAQQQVGAESAEGQSEEGDEEYQATCAPGGRWRPRPSLGGLCFGKRARTASRRAAAAAAGGRAGDGGRAAVLEGAAWGLSEAAGRRLRHAGAWGLRAGGSEGPAPAGQMEIKRRWCPRWGVSPCAAVHGEPR
jgi:hypothetical protein